VSVKTVAIVMDGNRRWARQNNLPFSLGHRKGVETLVEITKEAKKKESKKTNCLRIFIRKLVQRKI
jgi:undecaprenyl diphosphate synthase